MKVYETLAVLLAADQPDPEEIEKYEERARLALSQTGITHHEMEQEWPDAEQFIEGTLYLMYNDPLEFDRQANAALKWRASRN